MKKILLGGGLILAFIVYGLHQQQESAEIHVTPPQSNPVPTDTQTSNNQNSTPSSGTTPPQPTTTSSTYKDGSYTGNVTDAFYGNVQVKAIINGGKITDVQFLQYPNDRGESIQINSQAMPYLTQEAIQAQNSQVDIVSGATQTSQAFIQSLGSALAQAK